MFPSLTIVPQKENVIIPVPLPCLKACVTFHCSKSELPLFSSQARPQLDKLFVEYWFDMLCCINRLKEPFLEFLLTCGRHASRGGELQSEQLHLREQALSVAWGFLQLDRPHTEPPVRCTACCYLARLGWLSGVHISLRPQQQVGSAGGGSALR